MTNREFQKWLKQFPADAVICWVNSWDDFNEEGYLINTEELDADDTPHIVPQTVSINDGFDFHDETQILIG